MADARKFPLAVYLPYQLKVESLSSVFFPLSNGTQSLSEQHDFLLLYLIHTMLIWFLLFLEGRERSTRKGKRWLFFGDTQSNDHRKGNYVARLFPFVYACWLCWVFMFKMFWITYFVMILLALTCWSST